MLLYFSTFSRYHKVEILTKSMDTRIRQLQELPKERSIYYGSEKNDFKDLFAPQTYTEQS